ncbi:MAG: hypothetical protein AB2A00_34355 [Myxococcota bacterium]
MSNRDDDVEWLRRHLGGPLPPEDPLVQRTVARAVARAGERRRRAPWWPVLALAATAGLAVLMLRPTEPEPREMALVVVEEEPAWVEEELDDDEMADVPGWMEPGLDDLTDDELVAVSTRLKEGPRS